MAIYVPIGNVCEGVFPYICSVKLVLNPFWVRNKADLDIVTPSNDKIDLKFREGNFENHYYLHTTPYSSAVPWFGMSLLEWSLEYCGREYVSSNV